MSITWMTPVLFFAVTSAVFAGAWTQKQNAYYAKLSYSSLSSTEEFDDTGKRTHLNYSYPTLEQSAFTDKSFSFYGEYGFDDKFTGITSVSLKNYTSSFYHRELRRPTTIKASGISDLTLGLRYQVLLMPFAGAIQGMVKLPLGSRNTDIALTTTFADAELRAAIGGNLPLGINNYAQIEAGYTFRGGAEFEDMGLYFAEFGIHVAESFLLKATLDGIWSSGTPLVDYPLYPPTASNPIPPWGNQSFTRLSGGVLYGMSKGIDISLDVASFLRGTNTIAGETITVGVAIRTP